jgi:hypothetical protein
MSRGFTVCAAIGLWLLVAGLERVEANGGTFRLQGPWPSSQNAADAGAPTRYEAKSYFKPPGSKHQRSHRL